MKKLSIIFILIALLVVSCAPKEAEVKEEVKKKEMVWDEDYSVMKENGVISASLMMPKGDKVPVVLIIGGSGPMTKAGIANGFILLADALKREGIATISYDKVAAGGSIVTDFKESDATIEYYVQDAKLVVDKIKKDKRFSKVYIAGHSQGSLVAALVAKNTDIDGIISLAGPGRKIGDVIIEQLKRNPYNTEEILSEGKAIMDKLEKGENVKEIPEYYKYLFKESVHNLMRSWLPLSPADEYASLNIPVLIIQGGNDIQISLEDAKILDKVAKDSKLVILDKMSHVLKDVENENDISIYKDNEAPINTEMVKEIVQFVNR